MRIAVVDVAAQSSGALSVLNDFVDTLVEQESGTEDEWFIITSIVDTNEANNIHNIKYPEIKRSWLHRLWWDYSSFRRLVKKLKVDLVFSLQNNGLPTKKLKQVVYFHNVLLVQHSFKFSFRVKAERILAIYSRILGPYIRYSWKNADAIIVQGDSVKQQVGRYFPMSQIYVCKPKVKMEQQTIAVGKIKGFIYPATALKYKNFEMIIEAVKKLEEAGRQTEILFTISGNENTYAERIKKEAEKTKSIKLIGYQNREFILEKYKEYGLIITSRLESFPVPIREAMCCQTVIVALDLAYVLDFTQSALYNRLHIAQDNIDSLVLAMQEALSDEEKGNYVLKDEEDSMKQLINILKEAVAE